MKHLLLALSIAFTLFTGCAGSKPEETDAETLAPDVIMTDTMPAEADEDIQSLESTSEDLKEKSEDLNKKADDLLKDIK